MSDRNRCKPYGNLATAKVLVIGHDPKLQTGSTRAEFTFFMDYMEECRPATTSERAKHDLALCTYCYIKTLTGRSASFEDIYFTNLCNQFLERNGKGTILIQCSIADQDIQEIEEILNKGSFEVILPMAQQVFYHLVRKGFVEGASSENLATFLKKSQPRQKAAEQGIYVPVGAAAFVDVCGNRYTHRSGIPIVPILHVKQWLRGFMISPKYYCPMRKTGTNVRKILNPKADTTKRNEIHP